MAKEYIDREAAKKAFCDYCDWAEAGSEYCQSCPDPVGRIPAADVAPVTHGKWINPHWQDSTHCMNCNQCEYEAQHRVYHGVEKYYHYCPNCGARMDGDA